MRMCPVRDNVNIDLSPTRAFVCPGGRSFGDLVGLQQANHFGDPVRSVKPDGVRRVAGRGNPGGLSGHSD